MQLWALINKEIKVMFRNVILYFGDIMIPFVIIGVGLLSSDSLIKEARISIVWAGIICFAISSNLSVAQTQMHKERETKTLLFHYKAGVNKLNFFISKIIPGIMQFIVKMGIFVVVITTLDLFEYYFRLQHILLWLLVCVCCLSVGHLLGIIFEHFGFALDLLLTMPVLLTAYMPKSVFGPLMEVNPFYGVYKIVENMIN